MRRTSPPAVLGEFELIVLLAVLRLEAREAVAYGSTIRDEIAAQADRAVARGAIYVTLDRLERKGLLSSRFAGASHVRDHRPKRLFTATSEGRRAIQQAVALVNRLQAGLNLVRESR